MIKKTELAYKTIDTLQKVNTVLKANNLKNIIDFEFSDMKIP